MDFDKLHKIERCLNELELTERETIELIKKLEEQLNYSIKYGYGVKVDFLFNH